MRVTSSFLFYILGAILLSHILLPILLVVPRLSQIDLAKGMMREELARALFLSIWTATLSTIICALTGIPLAYTMSRTKSFLADSLRTLMVLPMTVPPLISGALLISVYGAESFIGSLAKSLGIGITQTPLGIILAQVYVASPFVVLTSSVAFERVDRHYEYVSRVLGKGVLATFFKVTLPMASRGIAAGLILGWVRAVGEFGATVMMAYNPKTVSVQLWEDNAVGGLNLAVSGVAFVIIVSFLSLVFWAWVTRMGRGEGLRLGVQLAEN